MRSILVFTIVLLSALRIAGGAAIASQATSTTTENANSLPSPIAVVPYRVEDSGWLTVAVEVNGQGPYNFVIDTGASHSLVFEKLRAEQNLQLSGGPPQRVLGTGSETRLPTYSVGEVSIGDAKIDDLVTVVLPALTPDIADEDNSPDGILGLDFLANFRLVFDRSGYELKIYPNGATPEPQEAKWRTIPLAPEDFGLDAGVLYTAPGRLNNRKMDFLLDTGSVAVVINYPAFNRVRQSTIEVNVRPSRGNERSSAVIDALSKRTDASVHRFRWLSAGGARWARMNIVVIDAPIFKDLARDREPFGLLGVNLFADRSFSLDFARQEVRVDRKRRSR